MPTLAAFKHIPLVSGGFMPPSHSRLMIWRLVAEIRKIATILPNRHLFVAYNHHNKNNNNDACEREKYNMPFEKSN